MTQDATAQERLWLVDENDAPLGHCRRGDAHRLGLRHRAAHILVYDAVDQVFLQKRSPNKDVNPGLWDSSAAGHVDYGETYDACARRELLEELGLAAGDRLQYLFKLEADAHTGFEFVQVYRLRCDSTLVPNADEIAAGVWLTSAELDDWVDDEHAPLTSSLRLIWRTLRSNAFPLLLSPIAPT
ncbi:NUDIX domain-containing protein [Methylococcus sp. EFPC2]|uniref:NUDIX hydrolase n=1 Tax=Methylococcus sp. EFPC2 TaxID=2812648 RepID=UPI001966F595|nr:NUDIX domain-containing protein [Methylococcus sp. EFPC2]QSA96072.1 NUDIX domain-containing protein [Methylococcus sp. EFPC2]